MNGEELIVRYMEYLRNRGYAETTIELHKHEAVGILKYMKQSRRKERMQDIHKEDIKSYQDKVYVERRRFDGKPLSISTKSHKLMVLKSLFKYLVKTGDIVYNPTQDIELPKRNIREVREILTEKELRKMLEAADMSRDLGIRDRAILELLYSTGLRNSELRELKMDDIDLEQGEVRIRNGKGYFGAKERIVPLGRIASAYLEEYINKSRPNLVREKDTKHLFVNYNGEGSLDLSTITRMVKKYAILAEIKKKNIGAHTMRHTCATHFLRGGADIRYVQELLGHSSLDTTRLYTKIEISDLKKVHAKTHPREKI